MEEWREAWLFDTVPYLWNTPLSHTCTTHYLQSFNFELKETSNAVFLLKLCWNVTSTEDVEILGRICLRLKINEGHRSQYFPSASFVLPLRSPEINLALTLRAVSLLHTTHSVSPHCFSRRVGSGTLSLNSRVKSLMIGKPSSPRRQSSPVFESLLSCDLNGTINRNLGCRFAFAIILMASSFCLNPNRHLNSSVEVCLLNACSKLYSRLPGFLVAPILTIIYSWLLYLNGSSKA